MLTVPGIVDIIKGIQGGKRRLNKHTTNVNYWALINPREISTNMRRYKATRINPSDLADALWLICKDCYITHREL